jgi:hypothetical protein
MNKDCKLKKNHTAICVTFFLEMITTISIIEQKIEARFAFKILDFYFKFDNQG